MGRIPIRATLSFFASASVALVASVNLARATANPKVLSTNYTLVNFSSSQANVAVNYYLDDGSNWPASTTSFTLPADGGQLIVSQYFDTQMNAGRGSAVVSADQPVGAVVQFLARNQTPTSGAYISPTTGEPTYYLPLVQRNSNNGTASVIIIQNTGSSSISVSIALRASSGSSGGDFTKSNVTIGAGASYYYDLTLETRTNVPNGWYGSATVSTTDGALVAISNMFSGPDQLLTYNGFPASRLTNTWFVPLFASRLTNNLSTPVSVQNLSGSTIAAGNLLMTCKRDPGSSTPPDTLTLQNSQSIADGQSYFFNPVTDLNITTNWYGSCKVSAPGNVAAFVQMRQPGVNNNAGAYEAIPSNGVNTKVIVPLVAKLLSNGFSTPVTIQNLSNSAALVSISYIPNRACGCGTFTENNLIIPAESSLIKNFRLSATGPIPTAWYGSMIVQSTEAPIDGFVQLTTVGAVTGDNLLAHGVFSMP